MSVDQLLMPESLISHSCRFGSSVQYDAGETIHVKGETKPGLSVVLEGIVSIGSYTLSGQYQQRVTMSRGATFGEATLFNRVGRTHHAHAESACVVLQMSEAQYYQCVSSEPTIIQFLLQSMSAKLNLALMQLDELGRLPAEIRLAKLLFQLSDNEGTVILGQQQLADRVGVTVLACHKALQKLQRRGLIQRAYGKVHISDRSALQAMLVEYDVAF